MAASTTCPRSNPNNSHAIYPNAPCRCGLRSDASIQCWPSFDERTLVPGGLASKWKALAVAMGHFQCGIYTNGSMACWGPAAYGPSLYAVPGGLASTWAQVGLWWGEGGRMLTGLAARVHALAFRGRVTLGPELRRSLRAALRWLLATTTLWRSPPMEPSTVGAPGLRTPLGGKTPCWTQGLLR